MPNTTSSSLPWPASTAPPNISQFFQDLATALDQKVTVRVATNTARDALTKYDGMRVYVTGTRRTFRWHSGTSRWDMESGPVFTWTPTLIDSGGTAVTGATSSIGEYTIIDGKLRFRADLIFGPTIDGRSGNLRLQLPTGVVGRTTSQGGMTARLYAAQNNSSWIGVGNLPASGAAATIFFPISNNVAYVAGFTNATSPGATGTGIPLIPTSYPLVNGSEFSAWGEFTLSSWPSL